MRVYLLIKITKKYDETIGVYKDLETAQCAGKHLKLCRIEEHIL